MPKSEDKDDARKSWLSLLAKAPADDLNRLWRAVDEVPPHKVLRAPEIGGVMVRGRAGAIGSPFNLGEMTVTRCSVKLESGEAGHAYIQGRDKEKAVQVALIDALMQTDAGPEVEASVLEPLRAIIRKRKSQRAAKAAATKVDFFTMVRGED